MKKFTAREAYNFGYDCGMNGANLTNSQFAIFSSPENTREWERGKRAAEQIMSNPKIRLIDNPLTN